MEYEPRRPSGYTATQIALHWLIAALVIFQVVFGESMVDAMKAAKDGTELSAGTAFLADAHLYVGIAVLLLTVVRFVVRLGNGAPPPPASASAIQARIADVLHWLFYAMLFAAPVSGLVAWYLIPDIGNLHALFKPAFVILVALHAAAALWHHFVARDTVLRRMLVPKA